MGNVVMQNKVLGDIEVMKEVPQVVLEEYLRLKADIDKMHKSILGSLDLGATVEDGAYDAIIDDGSDKETAKAARAKVIELGGEAAWQEVLDKAPRKPYHRLRVVDKNVEEQKRKDRNAAAKAKRAAAKAAKAAQAQQK